MDYSFQTRVRAGTHGVGSGIEVDAEVPGIVGGEVGLLAAVLYREVRIRQNPPVRTEDPARDKISPRTDGEAKSNCDPKEKSRPDAYLNSLE